MAGIWNYIPEGYWISGLTFTMLTKCDIFMNVEHSDPSNQSSFFASVLYVHKAGFAISENPASFCGNCFD